ncbi:MAG: glycosyltransferase family 4 protein [Bacillota bacterium]
MTNNIVIAHSLYPPNIIGGAEISTQILAETLSKKYSVKVITVGSQTENLVSREIVNDVDVLRLHHANLYWFGDVERNKSTFEKILWRVSDVYNLKQYRAIKELLTEIRPYILHTQNLPGLSLSIWKAAKELNIPIVHTLRDFSLIEPVPIKSYSYFYQPIAKKLSQSVSRVIGISQNVLNKHLDQGYFSNALPHIVPNVVENKPENLNLYQNKIVNHNRPLCIGYFGQLSSIKGINYLIHAVQELSPNYIGKLYICGEGPEKQNLIELSNDDPRIVFKGKLSRDDTARLMSEVDLTIIPSVWDEPFGRVIIESYQVGTNVLASDIGGIPEVVIHKEWNLFQPGNSKSIIEGILNYYNLPYNDKLKLKGDCYEHSKNFSTESLLLQHEKIYEDLMGKRS